MLELPEDMLFELSQYLSTHQMRCLIVTSKKMSKSIINEIVKKRKLQKSYYEVYESVCYRRGSHSREFYPIEFFYNTPIGKEILINKVNWFIGWDLDHKSHEKRVEKAKCFDADYRLKITTLGKCSCGSIIKTLKGYDRHILKEKHKSFLRDRFEICSLNYCGYVEKFPDKMLCDSSRKLYSFEDIYEENC